MRTRSFLCKVLLTLSVMTGIAHAQPNAVPQLELTIEPQPLDHAVGLWAEQTGYQVLLLPAHIADNSESSPVRGTFTPEGALKVLLVGTGLSYQFVNSKTVAILASDSPPSTGGGSDTEQLDIVVVTAQKRTERLIDTPESISVVSADELTKLGATQFRDFANTIPGMTFNTDGAGYTEITLRGVTAGYDVGPTVGIYVDEVPYGASTSTGAADATRATLDMGLFDIERIEVLRGPQGTLYGASTLGGLIKYVSKDPDVTKLKIDSQTGISSTSHGGTSYDASGALNVPIVTDRLALRASAFYSHDGGYIDNVNLKDPDVNRSKVYGGRADLVFKPSDDLKIRITGFLQDLSRDGRGVVTYDAAGDPTYGNLDQSRQYAEPFSQHFRLLSGTFTYDMEGATVTSVSSYQSTRGNYASDSSGLLGFTNRVLGRAYSAVGFVQQNDTHKFTQEIRLSSKDSTDSKDAKTLEWLIGTFYSHDNSFTVQAFDPLDQSRKSVANDLYLFSSPERYEEISGFGDLTWHLTRRFDITGGLRYAHHRITDTLVSSGMFIGDQSLDEDETDSVKTYLANARYHFSENATGYLRYATGYRPGGPNLVPLDEVTGQPLGPSIFNPDRLKSYEFGYKAEFADRRFGIDFAGYYIDWTDIQISEVVNGIGFQANATGGATVRGTELTLTARPARGFTATGAFGYTNGRLSKDEPFLGGSEGERLPNVPRYTGALSADYQLPLNFVRSTVGATVRYVSDRTTNFHANPSFPQYRLPAYTSVDLRTTLSFRMVDTEFYIRNLLDERAQLSGFNSDNVAMMQPRTFGIVATTHF